VISAADIEASVSGASLEVEAAQYRLKAQMPCILDDDELRCKFDKTAAVLILSAPMTETLPEAHEVHEALEADDGQTSQEPNAMKAVAASAPPPHEATKGGKGPGCWKPSKSRPLVFLDVEYGAERSRGRIVIELFADVVPRTAENFRCLCTGEKGTAESGKVLHYKGSGFYRVFPGWVLEGGDLCDEFGQGGESIYGETFEDENFKLLHSKPGILSMVQKRSGQSDGNTSTFYIDCKKCDHLDGTNVVFGQVVRGMDTVRAMEAVEREARETGRLFYDMQYSQHAVWPVAPVTIIDCGEVPPCEWDAIAAMVEEAQDGDAWPATPSDAALVKPAHYQSAAEEIRQATHCTVMENWGKLLPNIPSVSHIWNTRILR